MSVADVDIFKIQMAKLSDNYFAKTNLGSKLP